MVVHSAPRLSDPDEWSSSLTYESPPSTYSEQPIRNKAKRVCFLYASELTEYMYRFGYPLVKASSFACKDTSQTSRYVVRLWEERTRQSSNTKCVEERDAWFSIGMDWGWYFFWSLYVDRVWYRMQVLHNFSTVPVR